MGHELSDIAYACGQDVSELRMVETNNLSGFVTDIDSLIPVTEKDYDGPVYNFKRMGNEWSPRMILTRIVDPNNVEIILMQMSQKFCGMPGPPRPMMDTGLYFKSLSDHPNL